ncbi:MAG: delta-60 repeat domain-containing protein [Pirellulaceae bacterium]
MQHRWHIDLSFGTAGLVSTAEGGSNLIRSVAIQSTGKIVTSLANRYNNGSSDFVLWRYTDGTLDTGFGNNGSATADFDARSDFAYDVLVDGSNRIVVVGHSGGFAVNDEDMITRFMSNGSLDSTFGLGGLARFDVSGDDDFGTQVAIQSNGDLLVATRRGSTSASGTRCLECRCGWNSCQCIWKRGSCNGFFWFQQHF